jgi:hypothetical protein
MAMCFTQDQFGLFFFQTGNIFTNSGIQKKSTHDICERLSQLAFFESPGLHIVVWEKLELMFLEKFACCDSVHTNFNLRKVSLFNVLFGFICGFLNGTINWQVFNSLAHY